MFRLFLPTSSSILERVAQLNRSTFQNYPNERPVGVFVGGTSGMGEHTSYSFARNNKKPVVYIVGRNEVSGKNVLGKLKDINNEATCYFLKHDLTLLKECDKLTDEIKRQEGSVNLIVFTSATANDGKRVETEEGIDAKMAVNYYSRMRITNGLMPLIQAASQKGENTRVVSAHSPGHEGKLIEDDLELKSHSYLRNSFAHMVTFNTNGLRHLAKEYPQTSFIHFMPGFVLSNFNRDMPWIVRNGLKLLAPIADSLQLMGDKIYCVGYSNPEFEKGLHLVSKHLDVVTPNENYVNDRYENIVWKHTEEVLSKVK
ncbi:hypothetical protein TRVA0_018S02256 [Trichomonascus vanleenenianus]|uniref:uncharacterized protein n=1 Tax=Trichomonascus vanleenenianus TaxID=2268995 RepID=UPI003EC9AC9F